MTTSQASKKLNETKVYSNLEDKRKKFKPKFKLGDVVRTADIKKVLCFLLADSASSSS